MGASLSTFSRKRNSPESSPPDHHEQVQQPKKVKVEEDQSTTMVVDSYQVFLSFRGPDTRHDFTDVLHGEMKRVGIRVFRDKNEIRIGQRINVILKAIENSEICVPILSKTFTSSAWCLREVEKMVELKKKVMPIFYKVSPEDVKLETDLYKKDMKGHLKKYGKEQVDKWETALKEIAKIKGMEVSSKTSYTEGCADFINDVLGVLPQREVRCHDNYLVGMDKRVESLMKLLDIRSPNRRYVVIHGMSGIGKTTLANVIYDKLSANFNNRCFLEDVGESTGRDLQQKLLEERFYKRKVLIVFDDVKKWEHIEKLVGRSCLFGAGSRIIVTTKKKDVLNMGGLDKDEVLSFEMDYLVYEEAVELFCWYAFRKSNPQIGFETFSREIIRGAGGLPLTLRVIGALLYEKDENVWRDVLSRIKKLRFNNVVELLRISYDVLEDDHKKIFLDIACLRSIAEDKEKAIHMWESCELHPHYGLEVLSSLSLIRIDYNSIWMHNQLKYLGKKIVHEESKDPNKRSRLWVHKEAIQVLMSTERKEKVEALEIEDGTGITLSNEYFASCRELRFLQLAGANITGDFENLLPKLRWLSWKYCPAILSVTNLFMTNLVNLDLSWSFINESWGGWKLIQDLTNLKVLDLSGCKRLTITPEFSENSCLERLVLSYCCELREIHGSIGKLKRLKHLELYDCPSLGRMPDEIGCLVNLEVLTVFASPIRYKFIKLPNSIGCSISFSGLQVHRLVREIPASIGGLTKLKCLQLITRAKELPESLGGLQSLVSLYIFNTIECKFPKSLGRLVKLEYLSVSGGKNFDELLQSLGRLKELKTLNLEGGIIKKIPASIGKLKKLEYLHLYGVQEEVPAEVCNIPNLRELRLPGSSISTLPSTLSQLKLLEELDLGVNHELQELPDLPRSLRRLRVSSRSLRKVPNLSRLVNLIVLKLLGAGDYTWPKEMTEYSDFFDGGIEKLINLQVLHLGIVTAQTMFQLDLGSSLQCLTLDFQTDLEDSDARPLLLPSVSSSSPEKGIRLGLKFPNLSSLKNLAQLVFMNCLIKDGLDSLGIQHLDVEDVRIENCSVKLIEKTFLMKNLRYLTISDCASFKRLPDLSMLENLRSLSINSCKEVVEITGLGSLVSLNMLDIIGCTSLERLENLSRLEKLKLFTLEDCPKLRTIEGIDGFSLSELRIVRCGSLQNRDELKKRCKKQAYIEMD